MNIIDSSVELGKAVRYALMHKGLTNVAAELIREVRDE
jgi:hypothetical protein